MNDSFPAIICRRLPKPSFLGALFRPALCDSPLLWGEDQGEGDVFDLAKLRFDA
jgi:hypothetical protein